MVAEGILILGQGLAGSVLAMRCEAENMPYLVVDDGNRFASSKIAAGIWNPLVFRRITTSWMADELIAELDEFYQHAESILNATFYKPLPFYRIHSSDGEVRAWKEKQEKPEFSSFLGEALNMPGPIDQGQYGASEVHRAGYLDLPAFLAACRDYFVKEKAFLETELSHETAVDKLLTAFLPEGQKNWIIADCRGHQSAYSTWWQYLPFGLTKGELLTIHCPGLDIDGIWNAGFFVFPQGDDRYCLGATFSWDKPDMEQTEAAKSELIEKFEKRCSLPFTVIDHKAGVRPTVQDRRPLIGKHPSIDRLWLFNGLGTKGVMLAPYFSKTLMDRIVRGQGLPTEVDIRRFENHLGSINPRINHPIA